MSRTYRSLKGRQPDHFHVDPELGRDGVEEALASRQALLDEFHRDGAWSYCAGRYGKAHDRERGRRSAVRSEIVRLVKTESWDSFSFDKEEVVRKEGQWQMY